jgi:hypothetical protein
VSGRPGRPVRALAVLGLLALTGAATRPAALGEALSREYRSWTRVSDIPVFSATHGNVFVVTYVNPTGLPAARQGRFPFPVGTVIVKEAFENQECRPGPPGAVFAMEKREPGYDPAGNDWRWLRFRPDGSPWGEGKSGGPMDFCRACHSLARGNDFVFGNGTRMRVTPTMPPIPCPG